MRTLVAVPLSDKVDFRAACFCHQTVIEVGFVCSVCLSSVFPSSSYEVNLTAIQSFADRFLFAPLASEYSQTFLTAKLMSVQDQVPYKTTSKAHRCESGLEDPERTAQSEQRSCQWRQRRTLSWECHRVSFWGTYQGSLPLLDNH
jgi:hypothetical protein